MLSLERVRELLACLDLSEEEIEEARTFALLFAEIVIKAHRTRSTAAPSDHIPQSEEAAEARTH
jgi:hypothetical protein